MEEYLKYRQIFPFFIYSIKFNSISGTDCTQGRRGLIPTNETQFRKYRFFFFNKTRGKLELLISSPPIWGRKNIKSIFSSFHWTCALRFKAFRDTTSSGGMTSQPINKIPDSVCEKGLSGKSPE